MTARVHESNRSSFIIRQLAVNVIVYTVLVKSSSIHRVFLSPEAFLLYGIAKNSGKCIIFNVYDSLNSHVARLQASA